MDFELSEDVQMVRDMTRDFAEGELIPRATVCDDDGPIPMEYRSKALRAMAHCGPRTLPTTSGYPRRR